MRVVTILLSLLVAAALPAVGGAQDAPKDAPKQPDTSKKQDAPKKKKVTRKSNPVVTTYAAMSAADKIAIQNDLIWTGDFNGTPSADFGERAIEAVKTFQERSGGKQTGILTPQERTALATSAKAKQEAAGWRVLDDEVTGARVGVPIKIASQSNKLKDGIRWQSAQGQVQIETFRVNEPGTTLAMVLDREKKEPATRKVGYTVSRPDFFVISGTQGLKKFYVRAQVKGEDVRGIVILYDQAMENTMSRIVVAISGAFQGFPEDIPGAPPRKRKVEYATGIVVNAAGYVVTDRQVVDGCYVVTLPGIGGADVVGEDKANDLALLRVYGVPHLGPLATADAKPGEVTLAGIPDPQAQGGRAEIVMAKARLSETMRLDPAPGLGYSGAPTLNAQGQLIGMVQLKPTVVAGPGPTGAQAQLVPVATIKAFLDANKVEMPVSTQTIVGSATRSVVRVICARR